MTPEMPPRSYFKTSRGHTYSFFYLQARQTNPTLVFLHGFPSHSHDWLLQINHFSTKGFGIVVPDLLGYGETSKPTDVDNYRLKPMSDELIELLDSLSLDQVIGVGHDFGSTLLSRAAAYYPSYWTALVFLAVGPPKLGTPFDVDMINRVTKEIMGFEMLGYIPWLGGDPSAQHTLETHAESALSVMFAADTPVWDYWFHPLGKMQEFVSDDRRVPIGDWYPEDFKRKHLEAFGKTDGYKGAVRWYQMWLKNLYAQDEVGYENFRIERPVLFVVPKEPAASMAQQQQMLGDWTTDMETVPLDSGHWVHLERATETNAAMESFFERVLSTTARS